MGGTGEQQEPGRYRADPSGGRGWGQRAGPLEGTESNRSPGGLTPSGGRDWGHGEQQEPGR